MSSSIGGSGLDQFLMSVLVDDRLVIDAGCIGFVSPLSVQDRIRHVLLTHAHMDHVASLPIFLDNVYKPGPDCPVVCGSAEVLETLEKDVFNGRVWPDLVELSQTETPFLKTLTLESGVAVRLDGLRVTPVSIRHVVPTMGFIIEDQDSAIAFVSDTSPTEEIWKVTNATTRLKAVFLEASFPSHMDWLADQSMHLTPTMFRAELEKLEHDVPMIVVHVKPAYRSEIEAEFLELAIPSVEIGVPDKEYVF